MWIFRICALIGVLNAVYNYYIGNVVGTIVQYLFLITTGIIILVEEVSKNSNKR